MTTGTRPHLVSTRVFCDRIYLCSSLRICLPPEKPSRQRWSPRSRYDNGAKPIYASARCYMWCTTSHWLISQVLSHRSMRSIARTTNVDHHWLIPLTTTHSQAMIPKALLTPDELGSLNREVRMVEFLSCVHFSILPFRASSLEKTAGAREASVACAKVWSNWLAVDTRTNHCSFQPACVFSLVFIRRLFSDHGPPCWTVIAIRVSQHRSCNLVDASLGGESSSR